MYVRRFSELGRADVALAGGKGANLGELSNAGVPVPTGFVLTTAAYRAFVAANDLQPQIMDVVAATDVADPADIDAEAARINELFEGGRMPDQVAADLLDAYNALGHQGGDCAVAVRSSATAEDSEEASFAGQQETFLNVHGRHELLRATQRCWASLWTARAIAYRARQDIDSAGVALAVVVQRMVRAEASGVMFTADPATGTRNRTVISAAWGLGESVVGGTVTTDDVVVDTSTGRVTDRITSTKDVMTVALDQGTEERPVPASQQNKAVLTDAQAAELAALGARIEAHFGAPQDIEWTLEDGDLAVVQSRPITTLVPEADWSIEHRHWMYVRGSIIEQMPDPLSPLFADLAERHVVPALGQLLQDLLPGAELDTGNVQFPTLNGYAYYAYSPMFLLHLTALGAKLLPLTVGCGRRSGRQRWEQTAHPRYRALVAEWDRPPGELRATELMDGIETLVAAGFRYYSSVQALIPEAALAEVTFTGLYNRFIKRPGDPPAETFLLGFDSAPIRADKSLYDLAAWAHAQPGLSDALTRIPPGSSPLCLPAVPDGVEGGVWEEFRRRLREYLERFGHTTYTLDIMNPVPADDPAPVLDTLRFYLSGQGTDPHRRQQDLAARREQATADLDHRLPAQVDKLVTKALHRAQVVVPVREDALADVGLGWPAARRLALELGQRLTEAGVLATADDVFWLHLDDLTDLAAGLDAENTDDTAANPGAGLVVLGDRRPLVAERRAWWRERRRLRPPSLLPERSWAQSFARWMPEVMESQRGATLKGTGASGGRVTAAARVLHGPEDFASMQPGEVLIAAITTPAWTPLFAKAAAVVTDIGGPLSHSSIVAREYGIPAVLGTGVATARIRTGQQVTVDGAAGLVHLDGENGGQGDEDRAVARSPWVYVAVGVAVGVAVVAVRRLRRG